MLILLGMPIVQIILFGFAISTEVKNVRTAILSPSYDIAVQQVAERLGANEYFQITEVVRSPEELQAAQEAGWRPTLLGPRVLRTETAGLAAAAWINTLYGDFAL